MKTMAIILALLAGGQDRTEFGSNDSFRLPASGEAGFFRDDRWTILRKVPDGLVVHVRGMMASNNGGELFAVMSERGPDGKGREIIGGSPVLLSGLPESVMALSGLQQEVALLRLRFVHMGYTSVAPDLAKSKEGMINMSHQAWLDSVELARKNKVAAEKRKEAEEAAARRDMSCEAEFASVEKTLKALALSVKGLESPDEFNRGQARKGIERNAAKLAASLKLLESNNAPPAALTDIKARVGKAIAQAKDSSGMLAGK